MSEKVAQTQQTKSKSFVTMHRAGNGKKNPRPTRQQQADLDQRGTGRNKPSNCHTLALREMAAREPMHFSCSINQLKRGVCYCMSPAKRSHVMNIARSIMPCSKD